jgi:serine/threonine protein kinase
LFLFVLIFPFYYFLDEIIKFIGKGTFGKVSIVSKKYNKKNETRENEKENGKEEEDDDYYVMKKMYLKKNNNKEYESILMEINACYVSKRENVSNIVKYVDHYYDERKKVICVILELCEYGSLSRIINKFNEKYPNEHIPEEVLYFFFS